jgi:hypothetical protein
MLALYRGVLAGMLIFGMAVLCGSPADVGAQDTKKDAKGNNKDKDDLGTKKVGIATSDGLSLNGYWFQGVGVAKQRPDAVIMMPAPGNKINDSWISLAKGLSEKNFSVLLFDWRGCGLNSVEGAGPRIFADKDLFWKEFYNGKLLMGAKATLEDKGLDWRKYLATRGDSNRNYYRDFMLMNDLLAARFFLDKQNDSGQCNTNRVWIVSEKDGAHVGMAFIAAEFQRNSLYDPKRNLFDRNEQFKAAGKDYAGIMAMSYSGAGTVANLTANMISRNALPSVGATDLVREAKTHLEDRLAMVLMYNKKESARNSQALIRSVGVPTSSEEDMKKKFKYLKEFDIKIAGTISGIGLIDQKDSFGAKDYVVKAMVEVSKVQNFGKEPNDREAAKMAAPPRFEIEKFNRK